MGNEELDVARELIASERRGQFWNKLTGVSITILAVFLSMIGLWVKSSIDDIVRQQQGLSAQWSAYIVAQEGRITRLEERQLQVLRSLGEVAKDLKEHEKFVEDRYQARPGK